MKYILINYCFIFVVTNAFRSGVYDSFRRETEVNNTKTKKTNFLSLNEFLHTECSEPVCDGELADIYCRGDILATAWYFNLQDVCPGTKLQLPVETVLKNFAKLSKPIKIEDFKEFCSENFEFVPYLEAARIADWNSNPDMFKKINNERILFLAKFINRQWPLLSRKFTNDVLLNRTLYPVVPVPNAFFVPGGRFQVYFYWDSFWILKGLLATDMIDSAKNILENFAFIIKYHGFIPNSGHIQLSRRSQPPLFTQMIADYFNKTKDIQFLKSVLPLLKKEMQFWENNRTINITFDGNNHSFFQYRSISNCPRPESFLVDFLAAKDQSALPNEVIWSSLASACESGLDFTSRWFGNPKNRKGIRTNLIIPVDLNVFIVQNFQLISGWSEFFGDYKEAKYYNQKAKKLLNSINTVLFDKEEGAWFDYDIHTKLLRKDFYPSNIFPLMINYDNRNFCDKIINYLEQTNIFDFKGGVPSSLDNTSHEQWDYPNSWAPSVHLFVESLSSCSSNYKAKIYAKTTALKFVFNVLNGVEKFGKIWEKYDARFDDGRSGEGGEYLPQFGFGWTNGAALEFIKVFFTDESDVIGLQNSFAQKISERLITSPAEKGNDTTIVFSIAIMICVFIAFFGFWILSKSRKPHIGEKTYLLSVKN
uniref:Trehalase n=1 Tax=Panagrolaimus superbus TaxID=310955 RepID=A0A914YQJ2_9BILA